FGTALFMGWTLLFLKQKAILDHKLFNQNRREQSLLIQLLTAVREIRLNGSEKRRKQEWKEVQGKMYRLKIRFLKLDQIQFKGGSFLHEMTNICIVLWSAKAVINGEITLGAMLAIQFIIGSLYVPISNTLEFISGLQRAALSLKRLSEVHSQTLEPKPLLGNDLIDPGDITINDLDFSYGESNGKKVLDKISITIPKGKVTAIVGHSGSGKTTLLKILLKLYEPSKGNIKIGKDNLRYINTKKWREHCGSVLQDGILFNDTLERNITESQADRPTDHRQLMEAVAMANLTGLLEDLPLGLNTQIGAQGGILSGGEKQR